MGKTNPYLLWFTFAYGMVFLIAVMMKHPGSIQSTSSLMTTSASNFVPKGCPKPKVLDPIIEYLEAKDCPDEHVSEMDDGQCWGSESEECPKPECPTDIPSCPTEPECPVASKEGVTPDGRSRYGRTAYGSLDQADDYFDKNLAVYLKWDNSKDIVAMNLKSLDRPFKRILDYGPSYASRMDQLCKDWKCELAVGVDPAAKGIERNKKDFPDMKFFVGSMDDHEPFPKEWRQSFDLVISSYTIDVVHRDYFFQALQNIHNYIAIDGILIIHVFAPYNQCFEKHEHRGGWTAIVDYPGVFTSTGLYRVIKDEILDYHTQRQYMHGRAKTAYATARVVMLQRTHNEELITGPFGDRA